MTIIYAMRATNDSLASRRRLAGWLERKQYRIKLLTCLPAMVPENGQLNQPRKSLVILVIGRALSIPHSPVNGACDWTVPQQRATNRFRARWSRPQERFFFLFSEPRFQALTLKEFLKRNGDRTLSIIT